MTKSTLSFQKVYSNGFEEATNRIIDGLPAKYDNRHIIKLILNKI